MSRALLCAVCCVLACGCTIPAVQRTAGIAVSSDSSRTTLSEPLYSYDALPLNTRCTVPEDINRGAVIPFAHALPSKNLEGRRNGDVL